MTKEKLRTARDIAVEVLNRFEPRRNYAGVILEEVNRQTGEKQRATDLVFGTIRNRSAIDIVIEKFAGVAVKNISGKLLNIIRVAVFELIYSPTTPDYSIVNEAVESAKKTVGKKQTAFVNAVLRQITRHITSRQIPLDIAELKSTLLQTPSTGCQFDTCFLPDPVAKPANYLGAAFSLPRWLVADWLKEFGIGQTRQVCLASNRRPSIYLRPNRLRTSSQELLEKLRSENVEAEIVPDMDMLILKSPQAVTELPGFVEGLFTVQDITASQAVWLLKPQPSWVILDLCAAPGVKTTQLAEATSGSAKIIATDIDYERLKKVKENVTRLGIKSVTIVEYEKLFHNSKFTTCPGRPVVSEVEPSRRILNSDFDAVLLDVPCSNTGVLARRIEARYRIRPMTIEELAKTQRDLLDKAATSIKPGGKICYSTCSIQQAENSRVVGEFLQKNIDFVLESEQLILPTSSGFDRDGGYIGIIIKKPSPQG
ncbi:MAG: hypothetical protein MUP16_07430 [Sedimentisphaerales bacterium]|nr:hypothetical protein [Sedimentisphaerales bacterium]